MGPPTLSSMKALSDLESLRSKLLKHFDQHRRELPWRETSEPYGVWVSEIMLQQTRVETAAPYFRRWMDRFPSVKELADADEEDVLKAWEGLGYYSRARNLHRSARTVREELNGVIPTDAAALRALPGIGEYSAGAIASIAFREATPAVDGNARRVLSRLFDLVDPKPGMLRVKAAGVLEVSRPGDWNQAVMELGATICLPRNPRCAECPVVAHCVAQSNGTQHSRPGTKRRTPVREVTFAVLVAASGPGEFLLVRRPTDGMLGGLWEFPAVEIDDQNGLPGACSEVAAGLGIVSPTRVGWSPLPPVRHIFSHLRAIYRPLLTVLADRATAPSDAMRWAGPAELESLPLPVAQRKILASARAELGE